MEIIYQFAASVCLFPCPNLCHYFKENSLHFFLRPWRFSESTNLSICCSSSSPASSASSKTLKWSKKKSNLSLLSGAIICHPTYPNMLENWCFSNDLNKYLMNSLRHANTHHLDKWVQSGTKKCRSSSCASASSKFFRAGQWKFICKRKFFLDVGRKTFFSQSPLK